MNTTKTSQSAARDTPLPKPVTPSEDAIDQGVEESFPASDPVSVTTDEARQREKDKANHRQPSSH